MGMTAAIREILREAGEPLTSTEIRDRIQQGYPELYGTRVHEIHYPTIEGGVIAQITSSVGAARDLHKDTSVRPMLISLEQLDSALVAVQPIDEQTNLQELNTLQPEPECYDDEPEPATAEEQDQFTLTWTQCKTYEEAQDHSHITYLHEWNDKPFYWGIARTYFGGSRRALEGKMVSGRYNSGYRHWIEGSLQNGAKLYVASITRGDKSRLQEIENYLICNFGHVANRRETQIVQDLDVSHSGRVPASIRNKLTKGKAT